MILFLDSQHTDQSKQCKRNRHHADQTAPSCRRSCDPGHSHWKYDIERQPGSHREETPVCRQLHLLFFGFECTYHVDNVITVEECGADRVHEHIHEEDPDTFCDSREAYGTGKQQPRTQPQKNHKDFIRTPFSPSGLCPVDNETGHDICHTVHKFAYHKQCSDKHRLQAQRVGTVNRHKPQYQRRQCNGHGTGLPEQQFSKPQLVIRIFYPFSHDLIPSPFRSIFIPSTRCAPLLFYH